MRVIYTITRSRRRTLAIHIKSGGVVEVRAPLSLGKSEIERFVSAKTDWIEKKQAQIAAPCELPPSRFTDADFELVVRELVKIWEQRLDVEVAFIGIRKMSSRWGSCTTKTRRIRLNSALKYCSRECLEYVIVHELAHLRENNHSSRFWAIVSGVLPDYKARQSKLRMLQWILNAQRGNQ
ncbi:MAG: M48 family metallopeptidase [Streptococcaceae bacterium]|nr:M48 family metallopeptidase [Streptococcaceae bacterium]